MMTHSSAINMDERRIAPRHRADLKVELSSYLLFDEVGNNDLEEEMVMVGVQTLDVSESGVAIVAPQESLDADLLSTMMGRTLQIVLELPAGTVGMEAITMRHELLKIDGAMKYLIGARIVEMDEHDRGIYTAFLLVAASSQ
ncbi:MAG: hypothetical protein WKF84_30360 [Pyrinomonadaceae bacterium]